MGEAKRTHTNKRFQYAQFKLVKWYATCQTKCQIKESKQFSTANQTNQTNKSNKQSKQSKQNIQSKTYIPKTWVHRPSDAYACHIWNSDDTLWHRTPEIILMCSRAAGERAINNIHLSRSDNTRTRPTSYAHADVPQVHRLKVGGEKPERAGRP